MGKRPAQSKMISPPRGRSTTVRKGETTPNPTKKNARKAPAKRSREPGDLRKKPLRRGLAQAARKKSEGGEPSKARKNGKGSTTQPQTFRRGKMGKILEPKIRFGDSTEKGEKSTSPAKEGIFCMNCKAAIKRVANKGRLSWKESENNITEASFIKPERVRMTS